EENGYLIVDGTRAFFIDQDILETIEDFVKSASDDGIRVELKNVPSVNGGRPSANSALTASGPANA
ncbi:MAG: SulP family inorganic anion transporter, partial [Methylocella sp.]